VKEIVLTIFSQGDTPMNRPKLLFTLTLFFSFIFAISAAAQSETATLPDTSYDVQLQLLVGSNEAAGKPELPPALSGIARQLKQSFGFTDYRVSNTFMGRIANGGNFEYKSISGITGREEPETQSFLEWSMGRLLSVGASGGRKAIQAQSFRFGAKVPVKVGSTKDGDAMRSVYSYEPIGLNLGRVGLAESTPTLIGTLSLPRTDGTIFLIMTVRPAEL
jgi:hypothetical protein